MFYKSVFETRPVRPTKRDWQVEEDLHTLIILSCFFLLVDGRLPCYTYRQMFSGFHHFSF